jgi:cell division protein FtsB
MEKTIQKNQVANCNDRLLQELVSLLAVLRSYSSVYIERGTIKFLKLHLDMDTI